MEWVLAAMGGAIVWAYVGGIVARACSRAHLRATGKQDFDDNSKGDGQFGFAVAFWPVWAIMTIFILAQEDKLETPEEVRPFKP